MWYDRLASLVAKGEMSSPGSLAGLAAARAAHDGQFFTPPAVVAILWRLLGDALAPVRSGKGTRLCRVLDTAAGSGRLLWPCDPAQHEVWAIEVDPACAGALAAAHAAGGFAGDVRHARLEERHLVGVGFDVALINPPFSLTWDSPHLQPFPFNARGRYGAHSSACSHWYALEQARRGAAVVGAIVPRTVADVLLADRHDAYDDLRADLRVVLHLPRDAFASAGADVATSILVFADIRALPTARQIDTLPACDPNLVRPIAWDAIPRAHRPAEIVRSDIDESQPAITLPVTRDWRVRIVRHGRRLVPRFHCGAAQAIVLNRLLKRRMPSRTRGQPAAPLGVSFTGQGALDLQVHLAQPDPIASIHALLRQISDLGMQVEIDPGILNFVRRQMRRNRIQQVPVRRWAWSPAGGDPAAWLLGQVAVQARVRATMLLGGRSLRAGDVVTLRRGDVPAGQDQPRWILDAPAAAPGADPWPVDAPVAQIPHQRVMAAFDLPDAPTGGWRLLHPGLRVHEPEAWQAAARRAEAAGIARFLTRGYQLEDAIELDARGGGICGWLMALGKARLAIALALLGGGTANLILVEARLIDEMVAELRTIGLDNQLWQVITSVADCRQLRRINLLAYTRLRMPIGGYAGGTGDDDGSADKPDDQYRRQQLRRTPVILRGETPAHAGMPKDEIAARLRERIAQRRANEGRKTRIQTSRDCIARHLRHRIHTLVADEAHLLRNAGSDQSRACLLVSPKRAFDLSGTPVANYPRDLLPLLRHVGGDGTPVQPYGFRHPLLEPDQRMSMERAQRGHEAFANMFCSVEWVTNEWLEDHQGAKREIPRIKDVPAFRRLVEPFIVRRVHHEPEVNLPIPVPKIITTTVPWDDDHLEHYLAVAESFANWFSDVLRQRGKLRPNLAVILAKVGAVVHANNHPQDDRGGPHRYTGSRTAKQRVFLDRLEDWSGEGHKTIALMHAPALVERFRVDLAERGIEAVPMHGGIPIRTRNATLDARFRNGPAPVLLATYGVCRQGYNIHQADRVLQYDRDWTSSAEEQAIYRVLRPQQMRSVLVERLHHEGSIDVYQDQMVAFKSAALAAGLDYGEDDQTSEFLHYETIFARFIEQIPGLARYRRVA